MTLNKKTFELLKKNKIFEGISINSTGIDFNQEGVKIFKEGDIIFQRNDKSDFMYLIIEGKVKIKFSDSNILLNKSDYDFFGEKEITDNTQRISSAVADTDCTVYCIPPGLVNKLLARDRKISDNILLENLKTESVKIFNSSKSETVISEKKEPEHNLELEPEIPSPLIVDEQILEDNEGRDLFEFQKKSEKKIDELFKEPAPKESYVKPDFEAAIKIENPESKNYEHEKKYIEFIRYNFDSLRRVIEDDRKDYTSDKTSDKRSAALELLSLSKNIIQSVNILFAHKYFTSDQILKVQDILNRILPVIKESLNRSEIKILKKINTNKSVKINSLDFLVACHQIIKNASEAMPLGGNIFILAEEIEYNIEIKIKDQGNGLPEFLLENIFDEFFTQGKGDSVGLGLFLTKRIIEDCGGSISAESDLGEGTTLIIKLPIA